jgi:hypothetical protein
VNGVGVGGGEGLVIGAGIGEVRGSDVTDIGVGIGTEAAMEVGDSVGAVIEVRVGASIGVGTGAADAMDCIGGVGVAREFDGSTFVLMATAIVIGVAACVVTMVGVVGETSIRRAVLCMFVSCVCVSYNGSAFGGGLSP